MTQADAQPVEWVVPDKIEELYKATSGNKFSGINRPTAGARDDKELPKGDAKTQLYSLATPNGQKVSILFEELGVDYDAHHVNIMDGVQFSKGFVDINPNSKIPCAVDLDGPDGQPVRLFETASILMYYADKHQKFIPKHTDVAKRAELLNWLFWQMAGQGPMTGNFGHFFAYAPKDKTAARDYGVARYGMETQRLCDVLDKHLADKEFILGSEYTIADICCWPWVHQIMREGGYPYKSGDKANNASNFLSTSNYKNLARWYNAIFERPAVKRGIQVCGWTDGSTKVPLAKPWLAKDGGEVQKER